jgi:hypothetical protein
MTCYEYSSNDPIYLEPNGNLWSVEAQYAVTGTGPYSYASIARLCEIPAVDQICVYSKDNANVETQLSGFTLDTNLEQITLTSAPGNTITHIIVRRCTPNNKLLVKFAEGAKLTSSQLNLVTHQLLFIAQEKQFKDANVTAVYPFMAAPYSASVNYVINNYVTYNSKIYRAKSSTLGDLPTNTTYWEEIANATTANSGFVITGPTTTVSNGQTLIWQNNKFVAGNATLNYTIPPNSITNSMLVNTVSSEAVNTNVIRDNAITTNKINNLAVTGAKIANTTIDFTKLSTGAPSWNSSGLLTVSNGLTITSGNLLVSAGTSSFFGNVTITGNLSISGSLTSGNTVIYPAVASTVVDTASVFTINNGRANATEITALTTPITTKRPNSKVLINIMLQGEPANHNMTIILERQKGSETTWTELGIPANIGSIGNRRYGIVSGLYDANADSTIEQYTIQWLDTVTDAVTYKYRIRLQGAEAGNTFALNRTFADTDNFQWERVVSTVILQEIFV